MTTRIDESRFVMGKPPAARVKVGYEATRKGKPAVRLPDDVYERLDPKGRPQWILTRRWRLFRSAADRAKYECYRDGLFKGVAS